MLAVVPSLGLGPGNRAAKLLQKCMQVFLAHGFSRGHLEEISQYNAAEMSAWATFLAGHFFS
jgi:hypothetical protein